MIISMKSNNILSYLSSLRIKPSSLTSKRKSSKIREFPTYRFWSSSVTCKQGTVPALKPRVGNVKSPSSYFWSDSKCYSNSCQKGSKYGQICDPGIPNCPPKSDPCNPCPPKPMNIVAPSPGCRAHPPPPNDPCRPTSCNRPGCPSCPECPTWADVCPCPPSYKCFSGHIPMCNEDVYDRKMRFWRTFSLIVVPGAVFLGGLLVPMSKESLHQPRPEYVPYDYMYIHTKRYPWGDGRHSLFHNPVRNAVPPDGYEVEDPYAVVKREPEPKEEIPPAESGEKDGCCRVCE